MKSLLFGVLFIIIVGFGGFVYRNAVEYPTRSVACPMDALVCPDGTSLGREGSSCTFPTCPPPNVSLSDVNISFAVPAGFTDAELPDTASVAAYETPTVSSTDSVAGIVIRRYTIAASSTALTTIQQTAIGGASGALVGVTSFTSTVLGTHRF